MFFLEKNRANQITGRKTNSWKPEGGRLGSFYAFFFFLELGTLRFMRSICSLWHRATNRCEILIERSLSQVVGTSHRPTTQRRGYGPAHLAGMRSILILGTFLKVSAHVFTHFWETSRRFLNWVFSSVIFSKKKKISY